MKIIDIIKKANSNLLRAKLRTFLTISAIFVGAFTITLTTALGTGAKEYLNRQLGNVSSPGVFFVSAKTVDVEMPSTDQPEKYDANKKASTARSMQTLNQSDIDKLKTIQNLDYIRPYYSIVGEYIAKDQDSQKYTASKLSQYSDLSLDLAAGRLLNSDDHFSMILPESYLAVLGFNQAQDAIGKNVVINYRDITGQATDATMTVVGVMRKSVMAGNDIFIDNNTTETIAAAQGQRDRFMAAYVGFKDTATDEVILKQRIESSGAFSAVSMREQISMINQIIDAITSALSVVGAIALFAASFGIINTLFMSVYERTQEVGLMKALGMRRSGIFMLFASEAVLVGFWGSTIAVLSGLGAAQLINNWASNNFLKDFEGYSLLVVSPLSAAFVIGLIMLIAFVAGTLPAIKAARLNPIEALRSE